MNVNSLFHFSNIFLIIFCPYSVGNNQIIFNQTKEKKEKKRPILTGYKRHLVAPIMQTNLCFHIKIEEEEEKFNWNIKVNEALMLVWDKSDTPFKHFNCPPLHFSKIPKNRTHEKLINGRGIAQTLARACARLWCGKCWKNFIKMGKKEKLCCCWYVENIFSLEKGCV